MNTTTAFANTTKTSNNVRFQQDAKPAPVPTKDQDDSLSLDGSKDAECAETMTATDEVNESESGDTPETSMEPRAQLHQRVETRIDELEAELCRLGNEADTTEHGRAISLALQGARDATSGGWDKVGEMEAMKLATWLDGTEKLVLSPENSAAPDLSADPDVTAPFDVMKTDDMTKAPGTPGTAEVENPKAQA